jgi:hypothetical protein
VSCRAWSPEMIGEKIPEKAKRTTVRNVAVRTAA